jgi:lipoprotein-anchoring transpeptidase ErfK/SrfK
MQPRRLLEMVGSGLVGAGLTVIVYELAGPVAPSEGVARVRVGGGGAPAAAATAAGPNVGEGTGEPADGGDSGESAESGDATAEDVGAVPESLRAGMTLDDQGAYVGFPGIYDPNIALGAEAEAKFPKHGLVTGGAVTVRKRPDREAPRLGLVRAKQRLRLSAERSFGGGCGQGWYEVFPFGYVCVNAGVEAGDSPPDDGAIDVDPPNIDEPMPLDYWRVNHDGTPFFHRLPSYGEQDQADTVARTWLAEKGRAPMPSHPEKRPSDVPGVVKEVLNSGYYVTVASEHVKAQRHFMKTNRGVYARKYQLEKREGSQFRGRPLPQGESELPVYWIVRSMPFESRPEGSAVLTRSDEQPERRTTHTFEKKVRVGDYEYYVDADGRHMRAYAVGVSRKIKRPPGIGAAENWVHVDLSEQTLVAYVGDRPVFTTLVSTGKEKGMTPVGVHRVQSKYIVTSMRDQPVQEEAYSIEDVPWTQYFHNNVALHGAFWHGGFGLVRSHGCVNLSPADARWLFGFTEPMLPDGWHAAISEGRDDVKPSAVVVTE